MTRVDMARAAAFGSFRRVVPATKATSKLGQAVALESLMSNNT